MEINKLPDDPSELKTLLKEKEKILPRSNKNKVNFDKLKTVQESITKLKSLLSKKKKDEK
jgi:hypothetical protein